MQQEIYENPLISRYASREMSQLFGAQTKFGTWRRLWLALAEAQLELGLAIENSQLDEMRNNLDNIDWKKAADYERKLRHDVMAHVHTFGDACPKAMPIIHLGATSCFVTDNCDLILMHKATTMVAEKLAIVIDQIGRFAFEYRNTATLGLTHLQPAQPTTVGKRATLWAFDFVLDLIELEHRLTNFALRGVVGTTGTQASFLKLFDGDHTKVVQLNRLVAAKMGFHATLPVTGQTYTRKIDSQYLDVLSGIAQSAHKMATDIRILAHRKEVEEPFEKEQIGSSAMPYKRNPMRSERICSLARFVMSLQSSTAMTQATQWMERTLDDSANRRLVIPQAFLAIDAILILLQNISRGLVVYEQVVQRNLVEELPFMATENILMAAVAAGGDRQVLHEAIRQHSQAAATMIKQAGKPNDLIERLQHDSLFASVDFDNVMRPADFIGRAPRQVEEFIQEHVEPIRARYQSVIRNPHAADLHV
ncbi:MAG TPA: adenylosuccinate lyase [Pirellulaceae bacterium]|nr:adenylosuccinate lyase [Pirellulaceae bacterium]HMO91656.1 adenylosuccinate lyase [Pirellulaceae bacterium]HMP68353.1 adenylosuccinate lyase [Pirellulaceae bacterium]